MLKNKTIIVVEGKTDTVKLKSIFPYIETIETNGFAINNKIINLIKQTSLENDVICFLDPDGPGNRIRNIIIKSIPNIKHAFIDNKKINSKKIGIAEADDEDIKESLNNLIQFKNNDQTITWNEYLELNLNTKLKRQVICDYFKIPLFNHKQLFNILNLMNINIDKIKDILNNE